VSQSDVAGRADFCGIRYAQCWEDADVLLRALDIRPGDTCLSIASAGDNTLAMLSRGPARVIALDLSPAQLACLELRVAAYRELDHPEVLELIGSVPGTRRQALYSRCRGLLSPAACDFWDAHPAEIAGGIGAAGKFEQYFDLFRTRVLPLVHPSSRVERLLRGGSRPERTAFYHREWDTWRWQLLFRIFFSRFVLGWLGRDPRFFRHVNGPVADRLLERTRYALKALDPAANPYLQWILTGRHSTALPYALRPEQFEPIRAHLDRLEWHCCSVEDFVAGGGEGVIDRFNLSDIFEYMSSGHYHALLGQLVRVGRRGGRLVYWNMLAERRRPEHLADRLRPLSDLAQTLHAADRAFFYSALVVEEIL
jgi:S-adenosylmethionine-diacylglycerol 3-amino-3-carboxypropyl transferase